jgi:hypothetical protein
VFASPLPIARPEKRGAIVDRATCAQWLAQFQLTDIRAAHQALYRELAALGQYLLPPAERLQIMESLRETVTYVQDELARRLAGRPLPLSEAEHGAFMTLIGIWTQMVLGYRHCLEAGAGAAERPLLIQRCLRYTGVQLVDYARMRYEYPAQLWAQLHGLYAFAEEQGFADAKVMDGPGEARPSSCRAAYVESLLLCHANPFELSPKQIELAQRWLRHWSDAVAVLRAPRRGNERVPMLAVHLKGGSGLQSLSHLAPSEATRYLDLSEISKTLRVKQILLQQGQKPEPLGLGRDCEQPGCGQLLAQLHRYWCEGAPSRSFDRRPSINTAQVCFGIPAIWQIVASKPFAQPGMTRRAGGPAQTAGKPAAGPFQEETWSVKDESVLGMRIERDGPGERLQVNQLLALKLSNASWRLLGVIRWLVVTRGGQLQAGLRTLPGAPQPVAVRPAGPGAASSEPYLEALLLPEIPSLNLRGSLIVSKGIYQPQRLLELARDNETRKIKLELLVERGADYERVGFSPA